MLDIMIGVALETAAYDGRVTRHQAHVTMLQVMSQSWASSVMFSMCIVDRLWWLHNVLMF